MILYFCAVQDGSLRVFKWPSMENILNESNAHSTVKDLHFRFDAHSSISISRDKYYLTS